MLGLCLTPWTSGQEGDRCPPVCRCSRLLPDLSLPPWTGSCLFPHGASSLWCRCRCPPFPRHSRGLSTVDVPHAPAQPVPPPSLPPSLPPTPGPPPCSPARSQGHLRPLFPPCLCPPSCRGPASAPLVSATTLLTTALNGCPAAVLEARWTSRTGSVSPSPVLPPQHPGLARPLPFQVATWFMPSSFLSLLRCLPPNLLVPDTLSTPQTLSCSFQQTFFFFKFICIYFERDRVRAAEGQRERE